MYPISFSAGAKCSVKLLFEGLTKHSGYMMTHQEQATFAISGEEEEEEDPKRTKFGTRYLTNPQNVFQHNAWDNVVWDEEQEAEAKKIAMQHAEKAVSSEKRDELEKEAVKYWDQFYSTHSNHFFKDRHWLFTEFPELHGINSFSETDCAQTSKNYDVNVCKGHSKSSLKDNDHSSENDQCIEGPSQNADFALAQTQTNDHIESHKAGLQTGSENQAPFKLLEVGCGVGNTVFPVLKTNKNPNLKVFCCDFSPTAIDIVKAHPDYDPSRCHAFVHDITDDQADIPLELGSLDVIIMIFVLSAVSPEKMQGAIDRLASYLKPGGMLLFRDYGRYDMAQLRFKEGRCLTENFYVRGDGTRVYFFTQDELKTMFEKAGLVEKENSVDRRLQVNRGRQLKMYRVWIQCKYTRPAS